MAEKRPHIRASLKTRSHWCTDGGFMDSPWHHEQCDGLTPSLEPCMCDCHPEPDDREEDQ